LVEVHPPFDAAPDCARFVGGKIVAGAVAQQHDNFWHWLGQRGISVRIRPRRHQVGTFGVSHQALRQLAGRQHIIHQACGNGTARHAGILGRFRLLGHRHACGALDGLDPERAVAGRAGQDDAHRSLALILRERAEKIVNRQPHGG
jgi:hypothetical protein